MTPLTPASSALYSGAVMHQRLRPVRHRLRYRMFSLLLDIDELTALSARLRLFSLNRFNVFSLHERDYGDVAAQAPGCGGGLRGHVERQLLAAGLAPCGGAIRLLTMPRILGYAFNPLSVYFCHGPDRDGDGGALQALIYEVHNTFGARHSYAIAVDAAEGHAQRIVQRCDKEFRVSPFLADNLRYVFRVEPPHADRDAISIGIAASDGAGVLLNARFDAVRRRLGDAALLGAVLAHPLLTLKVIVAIHWEALRLLAKGVRLQPQAAVATLPARQPPGTDPHSRP